MFRKADCSFFLPDAFVLSENASNKYIFIKIWVEEAILNNIFSIYK